MSAVQFVVFSLLSVSFAATIPAEKNNNSTSPCDPNIDEGCLPSPVDCTECYACNNSYPAIEEKKKVQEFLFIKSVTAYDSTAKLQDKVDTVFQGIIISAIFFIACASICVISVIAFCCHIRRSDKKLKNEVNALAAKLKIDVKKGPGAATRPVRAELGDSCNVVVADTDIMCV